MKKKFNFTLLIVFILMLAIIAVYVVYYRYYYPNMNTYNAYLNVFEELDSSVETIYISSINHRVEVKKSSNDKVKIAYYQKLENSNKYTVSPKILDLKIQEEVEDVNNIFFKGENKIDVVTIYVPEDKKININIESVYGGLLIESVDINNLVFVNVSGDIEIDDTVINYANIETNSGKIEIEQSSFENLNVYSASGIVRIDLRDSVDSYNCQIVSEFGNIYFNNELLKIVNEDGSETVNRDFKTSSPEIVNALNINTIRSNIHIAYPEENKTISTQE